LFKFGRGEYAKKLYQIAVSPDPEYSNMIGNLLHSWFYSC